MNDATVSVPLPSLGKDAHRTFEGRMQTLQTYLQQHLTALAVIAGSEVIASTWAEGKSAEGYADAMRRRRESVADLQLTPLALLSVAADEAWLAIARLSAVLQDEAPPQSLPVGELTPRLIHPRPEGPAGSDLSSNDMTRR